MIYVKYEKIGMENFCCYTSLLEIVIENGKMVIICGPNGVGKTTIFDSISFTLYGVTSKGLKANDVVNNKIKKNCHTYLEFSIDEIKYRIDRYYAHTKYGNTAIMLRDNQPYKKGSTEVVHEVERLLAPKKVFMNSIFFGQKATTFFTDLDDTERKDIFRKILKLDDLVIYYKKCSKMIDELTELLNQNDKDTSIKKSLLEDCQNQIFLLEKERIEFDNKRNNELNIYRDKLNELTLQNKKLEDIISEYMQKYDPETSGHLNDVINDYNYRINEIEVTFKNIVEQIKSKMLNKKLDLEKQTDSEKFQMIEKSNSLVNSHKDKCQHELESIRLQISEIDGKIFHLNSTIENNNREKDRISKEKEKFIKNVLEGDASICPTCNQKINKKTKESLEEYIKGLEENIININNLNTDNIKLIEQLKHDKITSNEDLEKIKNSFKTFKEKIEGTTSQGIEDINQRLYNALSKLNELGTDIINDKTKNIKEEKEQIVKSLEKTRKDKNDIDVGLCKLNELENEQSRLQYQKEKFNELINQLHESKYDDTRLSSYKTKYDDIQGEIIILNNMRKKLKRKYDILLVWKEAFSKSGIESMLIDESIPFMNERVADYLDLLSFGRYVLSFDTIKQLGNKKEYRDKISLNVLDNESLADSRDKFSAGQTRILDIAIILTLCDLQSNIQGIRFNLMLFDEIFDSLDDDNIIRVAKLLRSLTTDRSIYIITHRHIDQIDSDDELKL